MEDLVEKQILSYLSRSRGLVSAKSCTPLPMANSKLDAYCHACARMRLYVETSVRWQATFADNGGISDLRAAVKDRNGQSPCASGLRSICWKAFLLFENLDKSTWKKTLADSRSAYSALRDHFLKDIEHPDDISAADPLTDDLDSPWNVLRQDEELRAEIFQDVERCMPENSYFREPHVQSMLLDNLFIFCKLNKDIGYRQGMHEVLAPILWVISRDAIDPQSFANASQKEAKSDSLILECFNPKYIEHDAFTLFGIVMQTVKSFYETGNTSQTATLVPISSSLIVERSRRIHEDFLRRVDPELAEHLTAIEVLPQIFLIRWIRLLFGREFPFDDVLSLWDVLFAEDPTLELVDLICVSMLLRIRQQLIEADYSAALTLLLRYPVPSMPHGPPSFVEDAIYLRRHLSVEGRNRLLAKYSEDGTSGSPSLTGSKRGKRLNPRARAVSRTSFSPGMSPSKFLQEQGGIEGIIQEAARGVYSRGEKWGVTKALRGAVQGLQSASNNSTILGNAPRWSLDAGAMVTDDAAHLAARVQTLEQRNKALAKLLEKAMEELWVQQQGLTKDKADSAADALSLAVAKVQFVQVYLENPGMPFPAEDQAAEPKNGATDLDQAPAAEPGSPIEKPKSQPSPTRKPIMKEIRRIAKSSSEVSASQSPTGSPAKSQTPHSTAIDSIPTIDISQDVEVPKVPPRVRPAIAQSSFSWILGEDKRKSDFIAATPFSTEKDRARGKAGFLFGDEKSEDVKPTSATLNARKPAGQVTREDEAITLKAIKAAKEDN